MKARLFAVALFCAALLAGTAAAKPYSVAFVALPAAMFAQGNDQDWEHHDWEHDPRLEGKSAAHRQGFQDGITDGHRDHEARRPWHYGPGWKHPDRGYRPEYGDKHAYMNEYKEGYERGYKDGYEDRH